MTKEKVTTYRLGTMTLNQIDSLAESTGMSKANVVQTAIDRMYQMETQTMTSNIVIIPQKMSGTGTIHDLASQHFDREIDFGDDGQYAIVLASYYGNGDNYYIAQDAEEALRISEEQSEFSHGIIRRDGNHVDRYWLQNQ